MSVNVERFVLYHLPAPTFLEARKALGCISVLEIDRTQPIILQVRHSRRNLQRRGLKPPFLTEVIFYLSVHISADHPFDQCFTSLLVPNFYAILFLISPYITDTGKNRNTVPLKAYVAVEIKETSQSIAASLTIVACFI